jgi:hypothetical protein
MKRGWLLALILFSTARALASAQTATLSLTGDRLEARQPDGTLLWQVSFSEPRARNIVLWDGRLAVLDDGAIFDPGGRLIGRIAPEAIRSTAPDTPQVPPAWDPPWQLTPPPPSGTSDSHNPPFYDRQSNAWVVNTHIVSNVYSLQVCRSNGHDGTWGPMQTISDTTHYVAGPEATIDDFDNITIAFRDISGGYHLYVKRYEPATGWLPLQHLFVVGEFFQAIEIGCDAAGNVAVIFDRNIAGVPTAWTTIRNASSGAWSAPVQVSPAGYRVILPTVLYNRLADTMYLVYLVPGTGLFAHHFNSATLSWDAAEFLPGSEVAAYSGAGPVSRFPGVVDNSGNVTVFWGTPYVPYASRNVGGTWQPAVRLANYQVVDIENFAGAAFNRRGDVFGVASRFEGGQSVFCAFLYDAEGGWQPPQSPYSFPISLATRVRVSFYQGRRAVGTMLGTQAGVRQIVSFLYDGAAWLPTLLDVPGNEDAFYADIVSDRGEALLVYEGELAGVNQGIKATFLRAPFPADMNCDGLLNAFDIDPFVLALTDPAAYTLTYPDCYLRNADANEDGQINAFDIDPFVDLLVGP